MLPHKVCGIHQDGFLGMDDCCSVIGARRTSDEVPSTPSAVTSLESLLSSESDLKLALSSSKET